MSDSNTRLKTLSPDKFVTFVDQLVNKFNLPNSARVNREVLIIHLESLAVLPMYRDLPHVLVEWNDELTVEGARVATTLLWPELQSPMQKWLDKFFTS